MASKLPDGGVQNPYTKVYLYRMNIDTSKQKPLLERLSELMDKCYLK